MDHPDDEGADSSAAALTKPASAEPASFRRSSPRGAAEIFADTFIGADVPEKLPWWGKVGTGVLAAAGLTAALAWSWITAHALYILGPAFLVTSTAFLGLRRGATQREKRLLGEVDQHTRVEVTKARRELLVRIAKLQQRNEDESEAALLAEWNESNPLDRLIRPYVFIVFLTGCVVRVNTYVCNVFYLPKLLRCSHCVVTFRRRDPEFGHYSNIATPSMKGWSEDIPASTTRHEVLQRDPATVSQPEADAIRAACKAGLIDVMVEGQYAVMVGSGASAHEIAETFHFRVLLADG
jgi:hypothetical protein